MLWCLSHVTHEPALKPADLFTKTARARALKLPASTVQNTNIRSGLCDDSKTLTLS